MHEMAAEVPVSDVLCEAMEYLSKLGLNLRNRSENLREKRIRKDKLKNAHAVHKAATKVLLICELSKKSLDNVETGVRKVLSIVDASQAPTDVGGKTKEKKKLDTSKQTFYSFEYESYKLRISKKIPLRHFTSAKVLAKRMPTSVRDKYPVYYDCKLKRLRKRALGNSCSKRKISIISSDSNLDSESSCVNQKELVKLGPDETESNKNSNPGVSKTSRRNSIVHDGTKTNRRKSQNIYKVDESNVVNNNNSGTERNVDKQTESSDGGKNKSKPEIPVADESINNTNLLTDLADSCGKESSEKSVEKDLISGKQNKDCSSKKEGSLTLLFKKNKNINESKKNEEIQFKSNSEKNGNKKKLNKTFDFDDSSDSGKETRNNKSKDIKQKGNESLSSENNESGRQNSPIREPQAKKIKLDDIASDHSQFEADSDHDIAEAKSDDEQKDVDTDKPIIRCVNITKLLKPDVLKTKSSKLPIIVQEARKNIIFLNKKGKSINSIKHQNPNDPKQSRSSVDKIKDDVEYWARKKKELDNFNPKQFTINIERLPNISINFLLSHKLKRIVQGCKTICEVTKNKETQLKNNIDEVKNALLNESESEENNMTAQAKKVKDSLLNDSDSNKNEEHTKKQNNKNTNSNTNTEKEAEKIKSALLHDSDSDDKNEDEVGNNERIPTAHDDMNDVNSDDHNINKNDDSSQNNDDTNKPDESTLDPMKVKSSLLNDSSDSKSEPSGKTKKKIRHKKRSMQAKKMLLHYSSSSENSENSEEESRKHRLLQDRKKTRISSTSSGDGAKKNGDSSSNSSRVKKKAKIKHSDKEHKDGRSIDQIDGTVDENSDSSVSKVRK